MTTDGRTEVAGSSDSARKSESLSHFVARVLDQLSLSAWLPSAALVLLVTMIVQLGSVLSGSRRHLTPPAAIGQALQAIAQVSIGGALLLIAAVVVLTMLTQAFSFEAIRRLEGYWGTKRPIEWFAQRRCEHHRNVRKRLLDRHKALTKDAWHHARDEMEGDLDPHVISALGARLLRHPRRVTLSEEQERTLNETDWRDHAPREDLRRLLNVETRLRDYPREDRILPTRLGNVLRRYEDKTGVEELESFVQKVFDELPFSLQVEHDEQRTRLDLYGSMVFVVLVATAIAVARFAPHHWAYALGSIVIGLVSTALMYYAGIAAARGYGGVLVLISSYAPEEDK